MKRGLNNIIVKVYRSMFCFSQSQFQLQEDGLPLLEKMLNLMRNQGKKTERNPK